MNRSLILIKHAMPDIVKEKSAEHWHLSEAGRSASARLAERLDAYAPKRVIASMEPKATETGQIVAETLGLPFETAEHLHEHRRSNEVYQESVEVFEAQVAQFFDQPAELVYGMETADDAHRRFSDAVRGLLERYPDETLAVVAHGTVISLFVSRLAVIPPFPLWRSLKLPSFVVLRLPDLQLSEIVERI